MNAVNIKLITGKIIGQRNTIKTRRSGIEKYSNFDFTCKGKYFSPNMPNKTFEPSSGGIGIRLKSASKIFTITIISEIATKAGANEPSTNEKRIANPKINARMILEIIPADATNTVPHRLLRRLLSIYGTGFAQPIINPALNKTRRS